LGSANSANICYSKRRESTDKFPFSSIGGLAERQPRGTLRKASDGKKA